MSPFEPPPEPGRSTAVRRVRRSRRDRVLGGVCGGLARYLNVDPVLLRIAAVALALSGGVGVLVYLIAWIVIPEQAGADEQPLPPRADRDQIALVAGTVLVGIGVLLLAQRILPWLGAPILWPVVVVAIGVVVVLSARR
ncbi:MAG TPA: PspC domain-containing protein [Nakamurella multipartita]|nr:PspC domain-containing protein [Nakamurella multipartita]